MSVTCIQMCNNSSKSPQARRPVTAGGESAPGFPKPPSLTRSAIIPNNDGFGTMNDERGTMNVKAGSQESEDESQNCEF